MAYKWPSTSVACSGYITLNRICRTVTVIVTWTKKVILYHFVDVFMSRLWNASFANAIRRQLSKRFIDTASSLYVAKFICVFLPLLCSWKQSIVTFNSSIPGQNGLHSETPFSYAFSCTKSCILNKLSPKFVPKGLINIIPALVQTMARRRTGDKPLSVPILTLLIDAHMRH